MTLEAIQKICNKLVDVTSDIKWGHDLCFNTGGKMFLVTAPDTVPVTASFKASEEDFNELTQKQGFTPAPYLARYKWVYVDDINRLSTSEWKKYIEASYQLVRSKLPRKKNK
jgi:predicted DNA-binding protein (MmcQ/YjbR family)